MEKAGKLMRRSIHAFLTNYHSFTSISVFLVFPVAASVLLSQALFPSSSPIFKTTHSRIHSLFNAAGFPASVQFFKLLNLKFSQTIPSFIFTLPFTLTFLILAKASIIHILYQSPQHRLAPAPFSSFLRLYRSLLITHLCGSFMILSANASIFSLLFIAFNVTDIIELTSSNSTLILSTAGAFLYSVIFANTLVACNLAIIVSGTENCSGYLPILKAFMLIRGRVAIALSLALPTNLGMAAVEALFQFRVVKPLRATGVFSASIMWEAFSLGYMYSLLIVLDVIASFMFFKSCNSSGRSNFDIECSRHAAESKKSQA